MPKQKKRAFNGNNKGISTASNACRKQCKQEGGVAWIFKVSSEANNAHSRHYADIARNAVTSR